MEIEESCAVCWCALKVCMEAVICVCNLGHARMLRTVRLRAAVEIGCRSVYFDFFRSPCVVVPVEVRAYSSSLIILPDAVYRCRHLAV